MDREEELAKAIRELVKKMYSDLFGAYGGADYEGQYEEEIRALAKAMEKEERGMSDWEQCDWCDGHGLIDDKICPNCNGLGDVMNELKAKQAAVEILKRDLANAEATSDRYKELLDEALGRLYHLMLVPGESKYANEIIEKIEKELGDNIEQELGDNDEFVTEREKEIKELGKAIEALRDAIYKQLTPIMDKLAEILDTFGEEES